MDQTYDTHVHYLYHVSLTSFPPNFLGFHTGLPNNNAFVSDSFLNSSNHSASLEGQMLMGLQGLVFYRQMEMTEYLSHVFTANMRRCISGIFIESRSSNHFCLQLARQNIVTTFSNNLLYPNNLFLPKYCPSYLIRTLLTCKTTMTAKNTEYSLATWGGLNTYVVRYMKHIFEYITRLFEVSSFVTPFMG